ncbi:tetratricopeptide repeat protein [Deinococcus planocerae]|uniref:tetratricopeptide repeat protein n=1 Tax=Deinococcus planocerae TaxID=1737569 RepID=UPI000C7EC40E|nr:tetratricopeptide repeat protein [Deinococcus planocerae]
MDGGVRGDRRATRLELSGAAGGDAQTGVDALVGAAEQLVGADAPRAAEVAREARSAARGAVYPAGEVRALLVLGAALAERGMRDEARDAFGRARNVARRAGDLPGVMEALGADGKLMLDYGDIAAAEAQFLEALGLARAHGHLAVQARMLNRLSGARHTRGAYAEALAALEEALAAHRALGDHAGESSCLCNIGNLYVSLGRYPEALGALTEAHALLRGRGDDARTLNRTVLNLGTLYLDMGDVDRAVEHFGQALALARSGGDTLVEVVALLNIGAARQEAGQDDEARAQLLGARERARAIGYAPGEVSALDGLGRLHERAGELGEAVASHARALELARRGEDVEGQLDALHHLGRLAARRDELPLALARLGEALRLAREVKRKKSECEVLLALADVLERQGDAAQALALYREHHRVERELFTEEGDRKTRELTARFDIERARQEAEAQRERTEIERRAREGAERTVLERTAALERAQLEVAARLATAAEYRDDATGEHTWRVGHGTARLAAHLGLPAAQVELARVAARLHDVGKIGIPDAILLKAGPLTPGEYDEMRAHAALGARLLASGESALLQMAEDIAWSHHERWDGRGYPRGLAGEAIPLMGRIVAVADVFDALTHARPYKAAWTREQALAELHRGRDTQFDPRVVDAALCVFGAATYEEDMRRELRAQREAGAQFHLPALQGPGQDVAALRAHYEHLLAEQTRDLERARREAESTARRLELAARTDVLTNLPNRRAFEEDLERALREAAHGDSVLVLSMDLDGLKAVNDHQGHERGDDLLRAFARTLQAALGDRGEVYRIGGDEYAAILSGAADTGVAILEDIEAVAARVREQGFPTSGVSAGIAAFPREAVTAGELLRLSDQRMYRAKGGRRGQPNLRAPASAPELT